MEWASQKPEIELAPIVLSDSFFGGDLDRIRGGMATYLQFDVDSVYA
jgi:hypothetical protein